MKTFSLALAGVVAMAAAASAAPPTTAPAITVPDSWTGFYVGGDVGLAFQRGPGTSNFFQADPNPDFANNIQHQSPSPTSFIGGAHAGFNWQFAPTWVVGIEGDWQRLTSGYSLCRQTDINAASGCIDNDFGFGTINAKTRWIATVRGRLGWTIDRTMIYGTGGVAVADVRTTLSLSGLEDGCGEDSTRNATSAESSKTKTGWAAGIGVEHMLNQNWIVRAEFLHIDLGKVSNTLFLDPNNCSGSPCGLSWSHEPRHDIVRAGVSYKFGGF